MRRSNKHLSQHSKIILPPNQQQPAPLISPLLLLIVAIGYSHLRIIPHQSRVLVLINTASEVSHDFSKIIVIAVLPTQEESIQSVELLTFVIDERDNPGSGANLP